MTVVCGALEQRLLEDVGPVVDLFGELPQQEGLQEEEGP